MNTDAEILSVMVKLRRLVEGSGKPPVYGDQSKALVDIDAILAYPDNKKIVPLLAPPAISKICLWTAGGVISF